MKDLDTSRKPWGRCVWMVGIFLIAGISASRSWSASHRGPLTMRHSRLPSSETLSVLGPADLKDVEAFKLHVIGPLVFEKLKVQGHAECIGPVEGDTGSFEMLKIVGPLKGFHLTCRSLDVIGRVDLEDVQVQEAIHITGLTHIKRGSIQTLVVTAPEVILEDVRVQSVRFRQDDSKNPQILALKGDSVVEGDVAFEGGQGIVRLAPSVRFQGKVLGGVMARP